MKNFIQQGSTLTLTAPATTTSGQLVVVGAIIGVANFDAASGDEVEVDIEGVFELPKLSGDTIAVGEKLYWNGTALTKTAGTGSKPLVGYAVTAAGIGALLIRCNLRATMQTGAA